MEVTSVSKWQNNHCSLSEIRVILSRNPKLVKIRLLNQLFSTTLSKIITIHPNIFCSNQYTTTFQSVSLQIMMIKNETYV